jgi:hypothetical protein
MRRVTVPLVDGRVAAMIRTHPADGLTMIRSRPLRRIVGSFLVVVGALVMLLAPPIAIGLLPLALGAALEAVGIAIEHGEVG